MIASFKLATASVALALLATTAGAAPVPVNLLVNGSFENGLANWTHGGTTASNPVVAITYGSASPYPTGAYGEAVPAPNDATQSPDAPGIRGAYFVDDHSVNESLSQMVYLTIGTYRIGFDVYAPSNGYSNPIDASFSATIANVSLASYLVSSNPATQWMNFSGIANITMDGFYSAAFVFNTPGLGAAKDIVVDRAFIVAAVPEPAPLALFGIAIGAMAIARRGRKT